MSGASGSPGSRSTAAILALYVLVGACLLAMGADVRRILVARDLKAGRAAVDELLGADQLVRLATAVLVVAVVVAAVLTARYAAVARRDASALGGSGASAGVRTAAVMVVLAVLAQLVVWTALGAATDVADRQRIDALRAAATLVSALAAGAEIVAVSRVAVAQEARAVEAGLPRGPEPARRPRDGDAESGLTVVSEAQARGRDGGT